VISTCVSVGVPTAPNDTPAAWPTSASATARTGGKPSPTSNGAASATGVPNPAAPSMNSPKNHAMSNGGQRAFHQLRARAGAVRLLGEPSPPGPSPRPAGERAEHVPGDRRERRARPPLGLDVRQHCRNGGLRRDVWRRRAEDAPVDGAEQGRLMVGSPADHHPIEIRAAERTRPFRDPRSRR
jgi:hypothetical protein